MKLSETKLTAPLPKILLYGSPGCGKTALATTFGEGMQVLAIDNELSTCFNLKDQFHTNRMSIDYVDCVERRPTQVAETFLKVKRHLIDLSNLSSQGKLFFKDGSPIKALCVDGLTFLMDSSLRYILYNVGKLGREMIKVDQTNRDASKITMQNNASQPEWGLMINEMEQVIQLIRSLPLVVILTAHAVAETNANGFTRQEIAIPTKHLPPRIPGYFDEVWYMESQFGAANSIKRVIRTNLSPMYTARSNSNLVDGLDTSIGMRAILEKMGVK